MLNHCTDRCWRGTPRITDVEILNPFLGKGFEDDILFGEVPDLHLDFQLRSQRPPLQLTDCLQIHLLELPKYTPPSDNGRITDPIEQWIHFFRHAKDSTPQELIDRLGEEVFAEASGVLEVIAKTPRERELYEARLKLQRDEQARLQAAEDQGRAEGRAEGFQAGEFAWRIRLLQKLLKLPISEELESRSLEELASLESLDAQQVLRAEGSTVYLAQSSGLGHGNQENAEGQRSGHLSRGRFPPALHLHMRFAVGPIAPVPEA